MYDKAPRMVKLRGVFRSSEIDVLCTWLESVGVIESLLFDHVTADINAILESAQARHIAFHGPVPKTSGPFVFERFHSCLETVNVSNVVDGNDFIVTLADEIRRTSRVVLILGAFESLDVPCFLDMVNHVFPTKYVRAWSRSSSPIRICSIPHPQHQSPMHPQHPLHSHVKKCLGSELSMNDDRLDAFVSQALRIGGGTDVFGGRSMREVARCFNSTKDDASLAEDDVRPMTLRPMLCQVAYVAALNPDRFWTSHPAILACRQLLFVDS